MRTNATGKNNYLLFTAYLTIGLNDVEIKFSANKARKDP